MQFFNSTHTYGYISIALHWISVVLILGLFALGFWMVELGYYDPWYRKAPDLHRSFGILFGCILVARLIWKWRQPKPEACENHSKWERRASSFVHLLLYCLMFLMIPTGYLITTAQGQSLNVFGLVEIPAVVTEVDRLEDYAGWFHIYIAYSLVTLALLHAAAAVKHHFVDRDNTLKRMLGKKIL